MQGMTRWTVLIVLLLVSVCLGCGRQNNAPNAQTSVKEEAKIAEAIKELPEDEQKQALAQRICAVEDGNRLGSMGMPYKIELEGRSVFLCCSGCEEEAKAHAKEILAKMDAKKK